ncbi:YqeG family HAD IIIA-type phosphatase [Caenibacillus caldisaponilyticus]|uniref:YqeG family HAD IIIA-type phosphatase n=1 Tax=Caenibacillus caldisaponilyticus TaxID=1674942 RepID=UPI0009886A61|nr:YqeG family HAD IIIA-type phosphatase [Caenibacillus caldisaponilyticus]
MLKKFFPDQHVKSVLDVAAEELRANNIKGIITDLDNTLVAWDEPSAPPRLIEWFERMRAAGIAITVVSNNNESRVRAFCEPLNIPYVSRARKPMRRAFKRAIRQMGLAKEDVVVIGDQLLTDIYGAKRLGARAILVVPVKSTDGWMTRINRKIERLLLSIMRKKGFIHWED